MLDPAPPERLSPSLAPSSETTARSAVGLSVLVYAGTAGRRVSRVGRAGRLVARLLRVPVLAGALDHAVDPLAALLEEVRLALELLGPLLVWISHRSPP